MNADGLIAVLESLPKPVADTDVLAAAKDNLDATQLLQFTEWYTVNGKLVLKKLNGAANA